MSIKMNLTEEKFQTLLKLAYLGNYIINGFREDDRLDEYEQTTDELFDLAGELEQPDIEYDEELKQYFPSADFEDEMGTHIEDFEDHTFWLQLIDRLAWRDMLQTIGEKEVAALSPEDQSEKVRTFEEKYFTEIEKNGLKNIRIEE
jgi:hypothetical protein